MIGVLLLSHWQTRLQRILRQSDLHSLPTPLGHRPLFQAASSPLNSENVSLAQSSKEPDNGAGEKAIPEASAKAAA
jgi:hypothetical protein